MRIDFLTLFPEMFSPLRESILGRAADKSILDFRVFNIRDYSADKHKKCDDYPFGGGAGMVMTPQPIYDCIAAADPKHEAHRVYLSPKGRIFSQGIAEDYAKKDWILLLCGHYEGIDQRVIDLCIDEELSVGDYILTGGELAAMIVADSTARLVSGVLGSSFSALDESISSGGLEYPHYTRPQVFKDIAVPEVLISGNHQNIEKWRADQSARLTKSRRPDLMRGKKS